jgi:hypothetical protein
MTWRDLIGGYGHVTLIMTCGQSFSLHASMSIKVSNRDTNWDF